jgi:hypothetical protein
MIIIGKSSHLIICKSMLAFNGSCPGVLLTGLPEQDHEIILQQLARYKSELFIFLEINHDL